MKKAAGSIRIDLAQFREMEVFTQFASDLDAATKEQLQHGHVLMELLKQPLCRPLSTAEQVITLVAANAKVMLNIPLNKIKDFQMKFIEYMESEHSNIMHQIDMGVGLDETFNKQIVDAATKFRDEYLA
jgi:F-type H+-transporting ATPase subunit alpha